jgi:diguanylate cyclase (GGDEF)-like protein
VGDVVLREVAQRLKAGLRTSDFLARYGGEEFVVLLIQTDVNDAMIVAERLRKAVADVPIQTDRGPLAITVSIGVSGFRNDLKRMLQAADEALYEAKEGGRNRIGEARIPS